MIFNVVFSKIFFTKIYINNFLSNKFNQHNIITQFNKKEYNKSNQQLFVKNSSFIQGKKIISISPSGFKGFYELGILSFVKDNYNLDNYIFSGASAGSWNTLFMCYKNDSKQLIYDLLDYNNTKARNIKEFQYFLHLLSFKTPIIDTKKIRKNVKLIVGISPTMVLLF